VAKDNSKSTAPGSVGNASDHKVAIIKALNTIQECHPEGSELWITIDKAKKEVEQDTDEVMLAAKRKILYEEFKKEMDSALTPDK